MAISQKDIKILWGRSGNRCAICKTELTQDTNSKNASFTLGEQAHIVGEKEDAKRGKSLLTEDERNSYHNLILLCPNHHTEIDSNEEDWPVEKLHMIKTEHELWVQETLSETSDIKKLAEQTIIASLIDSAVELCDLRNWSGWTSFALAPTPEWPNTLPDKIIKFREKVIAAIWPADNDELKNSIITFSILIHKASQTFLEHSEERNEKLRADKFYKADGRHNPNYKEDLKEYEEWLDKCYDLLKSSTKAANWMADCVRKFINPMFFATEGKFLIIEGPNYDMSFVTRLMEFTDEEKKEYPDKLLRV